MDKALFELFDAGVDRCGSRCEKWDGRLETFGRADVLPLWVADMDFAAPPAVIDALQARAAHGVFGYGLDDGQDQAQVCAWMKARHALSLENEDVLFSPGVVDSLLFSLRAFTSPGDLVAVQPPVYGPFYRMIERAGCQAARCPLVETDDGWQMDFEALEAAFRRGARAMLLCSPHNPVGRVWTEEELKALVDLCARYGVKLIADEIHSDIIMPGFEHTPILSVDPAAVQLCSATKTFNLAGLRCSTVLTRDAAARERVKRAMEECGVGEINLFGLLAQSAAYRAGAAWLDGLIEYVSENRNFACEYLCDRLEEIGFADLQGTYLLWLDFRSLGLDAPALARFLVEKAGVGLTAGDFFGPEGAGFMRMNLAAPRKIVAQALAQIEKAVRGL